MNCEMCGLQSELFRAEVEGARLNLCGKCARFGNVMGKLAPIQVKSIQKKAVIEENIPDLVSDFSSILKKKRQELGLSQDDFAQKFAIKSSLVRKFESGESEPSVDLAQKFEKALGIKLLDSSKDYSSKTLKSKTVELTLGDLVKIKK